MDYASRIAKLAKRSFYEIRQTTIEQRNQVLKNLIEILSNSKNQEILMEKNKTDLENAKKNHLSLSLIERLTLNEKRIQEMIQSIEEILALPDPIGEVLKGYTLKNGIELIQKRVPLGTIFIVYESRPNVTIDVGALCIKSGNSVILRGGKEAWNSNSILFGFFREALESEKLNSHCIQFVEETDRACMLAILQQDSLIDLVVPRGGENLIQFVTKNTKIPVIKHDKGVCNLYIDEYADLKNAIEIAINAKLQRPSVCNAIENLVIHKNFPYTKDLLEALRKAGAQLLGCNQTTSIDPEVQKIEDPDKEYSTEYLDNRLSVKIVNSIQEAIDFIHKYGSAHSEGIVSENNSRIEYFQKNVDSAAIFINCSTRFHDGGQMGMGSEIGISTGRLHVRGPMGLKDLTTTVYVLRGNGQIRK
ncbi:MAG: glutamate-5-semialdehyde dehydrogenase [Leptonema sp. (in: bacteria)]